MLYLGQIEFLFRNVLTQPGCLDRLLLERDRNSDILNFSGLTFSRYKFPKCRTIPAVFYINITPNRLTGGFRPC